MSAPKARSRGLPAASYFLLLRLKESNQRKGDPGLPSLRDTLNHPQASGAAQLDLVGHAPLRDSNNARLTLRLLATDLGGAQRKENQNPKPRGYCVPTPRSL